MPESRRPRLVDVAERAGVSPRTVSNVLHNHPHIRDSTRKKVEEALVALDYRVNLSARALAGRNTGFIALVIPVLDNPYFSSLAAHVIEACAARDWTVLIEQTSAQEDRERNAVFGPASRLVDGVILQLDSIPEEELSRRFSHSSLVLIGEEASAAWADHVAVDNVSAAREATEHVLALGRRRIATAGILPSGLNTTSELRYRGVWQAMEAAGVSLRTDYLLEVGNFRRPDGADAAERLLRLDVLPDALICYNDLIASGMLAKLREAGVSVPEDIAIVGFDDNEESQYQAPPLTTIAWDLGAIAQRCVEQLVERSQPGGDSRPPARTFVGHELIVRESTVSTRP
ncbi:LacI family DNA-binding transcriptional regulator [Nesterenkonia alba]|uniref:LacI family DNA-binding transcriptional regulator n=1 Tax=Nesterenkonia alba TaxID=515814 RepID=UPI0003B58F44|nr:LacI family DNA-binding transcriptional regulator [Nesterenkonia alba]